MPGKAQKDRAYITEKHDKDARALTFMLERVGGQTIKQIAAKYDCSRQTVDNYLAYGRKEGLVVNEARQAICGVLIPMAIAVYEKHLEENSLEAARDLLFGLGVLNRQTNIKHSTEGAEDTLDGFRDAYFKAIDVLSVPTGTSAPGMAAKPKAALPPPATTNGQPEPV